MTTKTQYYVAASADGFIADREGGLDWLLAFGFEEFTEGYEAFIAEVGVVVMGSVTYEFVLAEGQEWAYSEQTSWVLTRRSLPTIEGADIRFAQGDVRDLHAEWVRAAGGRNIWIVGGGDVAAQVADAGLLDEILLTTMPVMLGGGTALLPVEHGDLALELASGEPLPSGAVTSRYRITR